MPAAASTRLTCKTKSLRLFSKLSILIVIDLQSVENTRFLSLSEWKNLMHISYLHQHDRSNTHQMSHVAIKIRSRQLYFSKDILSLDRIMCRGNTCVFIDILEVA